MVTVKVGNRCRKSMCPEDIKSTPISIVTQVLAYVLAAPFQSLRKHPLFGKRIYEANFRHQRAKFHNGNFSKPQTRTEVYLRHKFPVRPSQTGIRNPCEDPPECSIEKCSRLQRRTPSFENQVVERSQPKPSRTLKFSPKSLFLIDLHVTN